MAQWLQYTGHDPENGPVAPGAGLRQLLEGCWPFVDTVTLSSNFDLILSPRFPPAWARREEWAALKAALCPWLVGRTTSGRWFGYGRGSTKQVRYRYRADQGLKEALCQRYQDIFLRIPVDPSLEEQIPWFADMCLFSRETLFFGSVSHEKEAFLYPLNREMERHFSALPGWEICPWRDEKSRLRLGEFTWRDELK